MVNDIRQTPAAPSSAVVITPASLRDLVALRTLEKNCFGPDAWGYFGLGVTLISPGRVRLKALVEGHLAGLIIGEANPFDGADWIAALGVHLDYRRRGIGQALLAACEAALPHPILKLTVRRSNSAAIALYCKFGYEQVGLWPGYYSGSEDGLVMEKRR